MNTRRTTEGSFLYEGAVRPYYNNADSDGDLLELMKRGYGEPREDDEEPDVKIEIKQEARTDDVLRILAKLTALVREEHGKWREDHFAHFESLLDVPIFGPLDLE
jgi:hypothetical protein